MIFLGTTGSEGMAYVRKKRVGKYEYYQLVEGKRVDGKVRQRVIAHLGKHDSIDIDLTDDDWRKIEGIIQGGRTSQRRGWQADRRAKTAEAIGGQLVYLRHNTSIHPSAWKGDSANFALTAFYEVHLRRQTKGVELPAKVSVQELVETLVVGREETL
jgi:hypothetical protein